jgi:hypothetical protein
MVADRIMNRLGVSKNAGRLVTGLWRDNQVGALDGAKL